MKAKSFYNCRNQTWVQRLETNALEISTEIENLIVNDLEKGMWLDSYPELNQAKSNQKKWKLFSLIFFGMKVRINCELCPFTSQLISEIPEVISASFSLLPAQTKIAPHIGSSKLILRHHLPLIVPKGNLGIKVDGITKKWKLHKMLTLDDSLIHEAWNNTNEDRLILMIDVAKPNTGYTAKDICAYQVDRISDPFLLQLASLAKWKEMYRNKSIEI